MTNFSRAVVVLAVALLAVASPAAALADPPAPLPPRPGKGRDQHSQNLKLLASLSKTGTTNSDLAFWGHLAYQGNDNGFRVIDISDPVPVRTLEQVLHDADVEHVDILKLVVEGSEFRALRSLKDLSRIDAITGEIVFVDGDPQRSPEPSACCSPTST